MWLWGEVHSLSLVHLTSVALPGQGSSTLTLLTPGGHVLLSSCPSEKSDGYCQPDPMMQTFMEDSQGGPTKIAAG